MGSGAVRWRDRDTAKAMATQGYDAANAPGKAVVMAAVPSRDGHSVARRLQQELMGLMVRARRGQQPNAAVAALDLAEIRCARTLAR